MRKIILKLHLYLSLAGALFILVLGLTGCVIAFETELDHLLHARLYNVTPGPHTLSLAQIDQVIQQAYPGQRITSYSLARSPDLSYRVDIDNGSVFIDEYSGRILGLVTEPDFANTALSLIHSAHIRLAPANTTSFGADIVKAVDIGILFLLVTGVYLWWPTKRLGLKKGASGFRRWFDLHNTIGIFSLVFLVLLAVTGMVIGFDDQMSPLFYRLTGSQPNLVYGRQKFTSTAPTADAVPISPDEALAVARGALPGSTPFNFNIPGPTDAFIFRASFPEDLTSGGRSQVVVDQYSGQVLAVESSRSAPAGSAIMTMNRAIHTGDIFGFASKTVMSLASLMMVAQVLTGVMMWWRRKRKV